MYINQFSPNFSFFAFFNVLHIFIFLLTQPKGRGSSASSKLAVQSPEPSVEQNELTIQFKGHQAEELCFI